MEDYTLIKNIVYHEIKADDWRVSKCERRAEPVPASTRRLAIPKKREPEPAPIGFEPEPLISVLVPEWCVWYADRTRLDKTEAPFEGVGKGLTKSSVSAVAPTSLSRLIFSIASAADSANNPVARSFPNILVDPRKFLLQLLKNLLIRSAPKATIVTPTIGIDYLLQD
ncbi:LOW QUALITY PROTEIN: hypothetical protein OSB04_020112 [Centaurea solstitialis]|uniref:Uncharacterized protein n=1 Tax=Centaurea solstitialis TaxID=347529 RepID=A0AA38ST83_9ASTR|nr:LOW QUALITY PROTEIN: hypothetical protein OSB04_020112 [Centaurea solstitialis]